MTTIGYATLQIIPSLKGVSDSINKQLESMPGMGTAAGRQLGSNIAAGVGASNPGKKIGKDLEAGVADGAEGAAGQVKTRLSERLGSEVGSVVGKGIGAGLKLGIAGGAALATAAVAGIGYTLKKGFDRLEAIDNAAFTLKALGRSADEVKNIMQNATDAVKGTAFSLADAAQTAGTAVAAGIKPGQELTKYLSTIADTAAVTHRPLNEMGALFNKVQTTNKAYLEDIQQLPQLPVFQWLHEATGRSIDDLAKMASKGEIDAATFESAINTHIGGAATTMGQTFEGAVQNLETSVARLGANFITSALGGDPNGDTLAGPADAVGKLTEKFDQIGQWVKAHSAEIHGFFIDVKNVAVEVAGAVKDISTWLVDNKGAAEALAGVFVAWKVASAIDGVIGKLQGMGGLLRTQLPEDATSGATGISKALSLIVIPEIAKELNEQLQKFLADNAPTLSRLNNTNTPDQLGKNFRDFVDGSHDDTGTGLPTPQAKAPAGTRESDGLPKTVNGLPAVQASAPAGTRESDGVPIWIIPPGRALGGQVTGPGTGVSDSILARISNGEFIVNADATRKNMPLLEIINSGKIPGYATGGAVGPDVSAAEKLVGTPYSQGNRFDCSGTVARIINSATGSSGGLMTTKTASAWLSAHGFVEGLGGPGQISVGWYDRGPNPNDGHMAMTLSDGRNAESGGSHGNFLIGGGVGANSPQFDHHMFLPAALGQDAATPAVAGEGDASTAASSPTGGGAGLPGSFSGLAGFGLNGLGAGIGTTSSGRDLSVFGNAAGVAVSGQVSSALGVLGVSDTPGFLKAASMLFKVGGSSPLSFGQGAAGASPLSATSSAKGTTLPDEAHGLRAGQAPGPQTVYNIRTATVEDAFLQADRKTKERAASIVSAY